ncbi:MAG: hypothetical protein JW849_12060 [Phycisphaerae bacterium]|nr:hypothetical protein [Phycisphaerae bacterium]
MLISASQAQPTRRVSMTDLARPESMIYFLLRSRAGHATMPRAETEQNLRLYRAYAHDHRRQADGRWLRPADYQRQRKVFNQLCREAKNHFRQATGRREPTHRQRLEQSRHRAAGQAKLRQAAGAWADPLLRSFLLAEAARQTGDFGQAENLFARCAREEPRAAAFHQGQAMALMGLKRYSEALRAYMRALALKPDSREAVEMLQQALRDAPGSDIETPAFREAREMLSAYPERGGGNIGRVAATTTWLLPGKTLRCKNDTLPDLPMDRLIVQQAVGTPVAEHTLLVDERILADADEVLVQIDSKTLAPAAFRKSSRRKNNEPPMSLITVPDYTFTPLPMLRGDPKNDDAVTAQAVNVFAEMGNDVHRQPVQVRTDQNGYVTDPGPALAEGESAGILLTDKGKLAGVVVRNLDVMADSPAEAVYTAEDLTPLLKRIRKSSPRRRTKRTVTPQPAAGNVFIVYTLKRERFGEK